MELRPELIGILLFIAGVLYLLLMKILLGDLLKSNEEFYPDGLNKCPPETYTLKTGDKARCISCPQCPAGMELTPPCGTTLAVKLTGECLPCRTGTFSQEADTTACKECTDCGSREVVSSCTAEKDAECKQCPRSYYEDQRTRICKHCSSCCRWNTPAFLECIASNVCKGNCSQIAKFKRQYAHSILKRSVAKATNTSRETTSASYLKSEKKDKQEKSEGVRDPVITRNEESNRTELTKREINLQFANQMDNRESATTSDSLIDGELDGREIEDMQLLKLPDFSYTVKDKTANLRMEQLRKTHPSVKYDPELTEANRFEKESRSMPKTNQPVVLLPTALGSQLGEFKPTRQFPIHMLPPSSPETQTAPLINTTSFMSSFGGTISAVAVLGLIAIIVHFVRRKCTHESLSGYKKLSGTNNPVEQQSGDDNSLDKIFTDAEKETAASDTTNGICISDGDAIRVVQDLNLAEIPPDLEDILVQELDVPQSIGKQEVYGWQKVGNAVGIPRQELKYLETEYKRPYGSPTKLLLDKLGSQGRTISYLLDVLQTPKVQLGSVAASIRHRVTRI